MAITKEKKREIIAKVTDALSHAPSIVFVNFHGLGVQEINSLRRHLRAEGCSYFVVKKTLLKKACADMKIDGEMPPLEGELAMAWGEDAVAPARLLYEFAKKNKDHMRILGGVYNGVFAGAQTMESLATIPTAEVLRGMLVNVISAPMRDLAGVLDGVPRAFVRVLDAAARARA